MERMCPPFALQKWARWVSIIVGLIVLCGLATLFPIAELVLAEQTEHASTSAPVVEPVMVSPAVVLPPSAAPSQMEPSAAAQPARPGQPYRVENSNTYVYTVRPGEYWIGIANRFGISYPELRTANSELWSLRRDIIHPGDQMIIPGLDPDQTAPSTNYVVQPGDSWNRIAGMFDVSFWDLRLDNLDLWLLRGIYIHPGDELFVKGIDALPTTVESAPAVREPTIAVVVVPDSTESPAVSEPSSPASTGNTGVTLPSSSTAAPILVGDVPVGATLYIVRPGDTWYGIAAVHGIAFERLRSANPTLWSARGQQIRPADQMIIPAHDSPPPPEIKTAPVEDEAVPAPGAVEEEEVPAGEEAPSPAEPETTATPIAEEIPATEEEPAAGPMQPATPEGTRLHIEVTPPAVTYIVKAGEDWPTLAGKASASVDELKAANPALSGRELQAGDTVTFP